MLTQRYVSSITPFYLYPDGHGLYRSLGMYICSLGIDERALTYSLTEHHSIRLLRFSIPSSSLRPSSAGQASQGNYNLSDAVPWYLVLNTLLALPETRAKLNLPFEERCGSSLTPRYVGHFPSHGGINHVLPYSLPEVRIPVITTQLSAKALGFSHRS